MKGGERRSTHSQFVVALPVEPAWSAYYLFVYVSFLPTWCDVTAVNSEEILFLGCRWRHRRLNVFEVKAGGMLGRHCQTENTEI